MTAAKAAVRAAALARRAALGAGERARLGALAQARLLHLPEFAAAGTVAFYWAMGDEAPTQDAIAAALAAGKRVALPRVGRTAGAGRQMTFHRFGGDPRELIPGPMGLLQPPVSAPVVAPAELDLVVVPGVAFDRTGGRVGYGGGYYDRYLPAVPPGVPRVGFCFAVQVLDGPVPRGPGDVPVDMLVTDSQVLRF